MTDNEKMKAVLMIGAIVSGLLKFDGLSIALSMMFCTSFIEEAIKDLKQKQAS